MASYGGDLDDLSEQEARTALGSLRVSASYSASLMGTEDKPIDSCKAALAMLGQ